jgi:serine/threonine protein kinase
MFHANQKIGGYALIKRLGRGGFGEVWLAERHGKFATTQVAVKLPLDEQVDHAAIEQEAQLWAKASGHPNVLPIIEADEYDGQIVIVSEYAPDGSLEQWLKQNGKMPVEKAVQTTIQILDGLEFLHSRNIIHRDLKPANILLQGSTPRLADFGISRAMRTTVASRSQHISGTFAYMSPEALDGKRSTQTDIWSVGVNLYQFLTGELPFPNKEPSVLLASIMLREFAPLPDSVPRGLKRIISKALEKSPENRYKTSQEMREDLRQFLREYVPQPTVEIPVDNPSVVTTVITKDSLAESLFRLNNGKTSVWIPILFWGLVGMFAGLIPGYILINEISPYYFLLNIFGAVIYLFGEYSISPPIGKKNRIYRFIILFLMVSIGWLINAAFIHDAVLLRWKSVNLLCFFLGIIWGLFIALGEIFSWNFKFSKWIYAAYIMIVAGLASCLASYISGLGELFYTVDLGLGFFKYYVIVHALLLLAHAIAFGFGSKIKISELAAEPKPRKNLLYSVLPVIAILLFAFVGFGYLFSNKGSSDTPTNSNRVNNAQPFVNKANTPIYTPSPTPSYDIPEISANVDGIKLFESGDPLIPLEQRKYGTTFYKSSTRYVYYELNLKHPAPGSKKYFTLEALWYKDGVVVNRDTNQTYIEDTWTGSYHNDGYGNSSYGNLSPGSYKVEVKYDGKLIASKEFEVQVTIAGNWKGATWGENVVINGSGSSYSGSYSATPNGTFTLNKAADGTYKGTWKSSNGKEWGTIHKAVLSTDGNTLSLTWSYSNADAYSSASKSSVWTRKP